MLIAKTFYRGFPPDGAVSGSFADPPERVTRVDVFKLGVQVPGWKRWRVSSVIVTNTCQITAYYSVAFTTDPAGSPVQSELGKLNATNHSSNLTIPIGPYIAYSQPCPPFDTAVMTPLDAWGASGEFLCVGVSPGAVSLVGYGAVCVQVNGWEYRD